MPTIHIEISKYKHWNIWIVLYPTLYEDLLPTQEEDFTYLLNELIFNIHFSRTH